MPLSFFGQNSSQTVSFLRWMKRETLMPQVCCAGFPEAQLRERDSQLRRPACVVVRDLGPPYRVPRIVPEVVIGEHAVSLHTGGADRELHAGAVIVARIQVERDAVGVGPLIASGQSLRDRGRLRVEHPRAHVERVVVVEEADLGALRRRLAFIRIALPEVVRRRRLRPYLIVQASVDRRGSGDSECLQRGSCRVGRRWLSGGYGRLLRVQRHRCADHCRRQQEQGAQVREVHRISIIDRREEPRAMRRTRLGMGWPFDSRLRRSLRALSLSGTRPATSEPRSGESSGAKGGIRTPTFLRTPAPQAGASASSATFAMRAGRLKPASTYRTCRDSGRLKPASTLAAAVAAAPRGCRLPGSTNPGRAGRGSRARSRRS